MLLGETDLEATLGAAGAPNAFEAKGNRCEATLFAAELARLQGRGGEALGLYRTAANDCPNAYFEAVAAKAALHEFSR
ncbi:MAG: hypothetical protein ABS57_17780 [Mesorhizobium sp. SCN 65-12]|nr:MAG: hypothetical protein ABS57_17780 [Mesorhizobium sp. SCN 65-12]